MTSSRKITALVICVAAIGAAAIVWQAYKGKATARKLAEVARAYRLRAEQGDADAQYRLGDNYRKGEGVPLDYAEADRWYRKAADQGYAKAQFNLGFNYSHGRGVTLDYAEAARWYRKAADQGDAFSQYNLSLMYSHGQGVPWNDVEAARWCRKAADQRDASAQYSLGLSYLGGRGVPRDFAEAARWFRKAADQGNATARYMVGVMYQKGLGVPKSNTEAIRWIALGFISRESQRGPLGWTSIVVLVLALLILVPQRLWKRAKWLNLALVSAACGAMLAHELLVHGSFSALLDQVHRGTILSGFGLILWLGFFAAVSAISAVGAVVEVVRGSKCDRDQGPLPPPPGAITGSPT